MTARKWLSGVTVFGLMTAILLLFAPTGSAHVPSIVAECGSLSVTLTQYNVSQDGRVNTVVVTIDGVEVDSDLDFGSDYSNSFSPSQSESHTYSVVVVAWDDPNNDRGWSGSWQGEIPPCVTTTTEGETTTTVGEGSTTTTTEATTTTTEAVTTTTEATTTTVPGLIETFWDASATCSAISTSFDEEAISQIDVASLDTVPGTGEVVGDIANPFLAPGSFDVEVNTPTQFLLTPVVEDGYVAVPSSITVTVGVCPTTVTTPTDSTLPFTGLERDDLVAWGQLFLTVGLVIVLSTYLVRSDDETEGIIAE